MKKKLLTFLTLLCLAVTGAWADVIPSYESYDWRSSDDAVAGLTVNTGNPQISYTTGGSIGNVSGHYYVPLNGAIDPTATNGGTYLQVSSTTQIEAISVFFCPNGTSNTNLAWVAWGKNVTPNAEVGSNYGTTTSVKSSKSWDNAGWQTIDLSDKDVYTVRISRQIKKFTNKGESISNTGDNQTINVLGIRVWVKAACPTINTQPQSASYVTGQTIAALTVEATGTGTLTYQWYSCDDANKTNAAEISGATSDSYTPTAAGFYYVKVTDNNGSVDSEVVQISISEAAAPTIIVSDAPVDAVKVGTEVTLTATVTGIPAPTLQWYSNTTASTTGGTAIDDETNATYSPSTATAGTFYFYATATNSKGSATSAVQTIVVKEQVATPTFDPNGAYFENSQEVTLACTTVGATIQYSTDNGSTWTDYTTALTFTETTTLKAKAVKEGCIDSEVATATFTKVTLVAQTDVTGLTEWDWGTVTNSSAVDFSNTALNNVDVLFANISNYGQTAVTAPDAFNQTALLMNGQRAYNNANNSKHCQVNYLKFNTTVAGKVTVEYANTGGNAARTVNVNGTKGTKSVENNSTYVTETFDVEAGAVTIKGVQVSDDADKMLRIRKVTFQPTVNVTVASTGFSTFVNSTYALNFEGTGITPYVIKAKDSESVTLEAKMTVAKDEPVLLYKDGGATKSVPVIASATAADDNLLVAGTGATVSYTEQNHYYVLATVDNVTGFYRANNNPVPVGKAYLNAGTVNTARFLALDLDGESTGIAEMQAVKSIENGKFYNLNGQQVAQPTKGLYIVNGRKVVVK